MSTSWRAPGAWLAVAAAACALIACGAEELSSEEYNAQLDSVFTEFNTELPKASSELTPASSLEDRAAALTAGEPVIGNAISDLEEIEPPTDLADLHERLIALFESFATATRDAREAAESDDPQGLLDYQSEIAGFQEDLAVLSQDFREAGLGVAAPTTGQDTAPDKTEDGGGKAVPDGERGDRK